VPWLNAAASPPTAAVGDGIPTASPPSTDSAAAAVIVASELLTRHTSGSVKPSAAWNYLELGLSGRSRHSPSDR
jgi:hypothetical protein